MNGKKEFYAISFDLEQKALDKFYQKSRRSAYRELGNFFHQNGYEHMEGSVYHSEEYQEPFEFYNMIKEMNTQLPWVKDCVKEMHRTVIPIDEIVDVKEILLGLEQRHKNPIKESDNTKETNPIKRVAQQQQENNSDKEI